MGHRCFPVNFVKLTAPFLLGCFLPLLKPWAHTDSDATEFLNYSRFVHPNILRSSWHFCAYFWQTKAFRCFSRASLTFDIPFYDKERPCECGDITFLWVGS